LDLLSVQNSDGRIFLILANSSGHSLGAKVAAIVKFRRNRRSSIIQPEQSVPPLQVAPSPLGTPIFTNPTFSPSSDTMQIHTPAEHPPTRANLRAWWSNFNFAQKTKKEAMGGPYRRTSTSTFLFNVSSNYPPAFDTANHPVFGKSLKESLKYANVQISTADANGRLYVWGYIPVVVAKW